MYIQCLTGPLRGQTYPVHSQGMLIGRERDCTIRFAADAPGISRYHCSLTWENGTLVLTDLGSTSGTYSSDNRKLPPQFPVKVAPGAKFYLGNSRYTFQALP